MMMFLSELLRYSYTALRGNSPAHLLRRDRDTYGYHRDFPNPIARPNVPSDTDEILHGAVEIDALDKVTLNKRYLEVCREYRSLTDRYDRRLIAERLAVHKWAQQVRRPGRPTRKSV